METRRTTRSLRGHQSAYEDQARVIQERISTCHEAYRDAREVLDDLKLQANDSAQRRSQLSDRLLLNLLQLQAHYAVYDTAVYDWTALVQTYNIAHEDSDWAESMRRQHNDFFALTPTLDAQLRQLIAIYRNRHDQATQPSDDLPPSPELGRGSQPTPTTPARQTDHTDAPVDASDNVSTDTNASSGERGEPEPGLTAPANSAGQISPARVSASGVPSPANSAGKDDRVETPTRTSPAAEQTTPTAVRPMPRRRVAIRDPPADVHEFDNLSLRSEATSDDELYYDTSPAPPFQWSGAQHDACVARTPPPTPYGSDHRDPHEYRRTTTASYGLFAHSDGLVTNASPMAWQNFHTGNGRHHETMLYGTRPSTRNNSARGPDSHGPGFGTPLAMASQHAASAAPAARAANSAAGNAGTRFGSSQMDPSDLTSMRGAADTTRYAEHRDRLRHVFRDAAPPAGRGDYSAFYSVPAAAASAGPTPAAWTTHMPASTAHVRPRSPPLPVDHGVDFGPENASKFYQNAVYTRSSIPSQPLVLKELPLEKFGGDIRAYPAFRNHFLELVENRKDFEPRHKLQYLLQCLIDEPLQEARRYMITNNNYFKAIDRLENKYGNKGRLLLTLNQCFYDLKSPGPAASDVRRFYDEASHLVDEMQQIGENTNVNSFWKHAFITKLHPTLRQKVFEKVSGDPLEAPLGKLLNCLASHLLSLEASDLALSFRSATTDAGNSGRDGQLCRPAPRSTAHSTGTYATDADATYAANAKPSRKLKCAYCGRDHWASKCDIYISRAQRYKRARKLNYCLFCLRTGHWIGTCPKRTPEPCKQCNDGHHHRSLCKASFRQGPRPFATLRHSPVRATSPGVPKLPTEHGSSSQQANRDTTSVSRPGAPERPTAKTVRFSSAHHSSTLAPSNSKEPRWKKSEDPRTDPQGRVGTTRPMTASVAENVKQMDANACGGDGLLYGHPSHLTTDRRSTTAEAPWNDRTLGYGSGATLGVPDAPRKRGSWADEEASLPDSTGHCSDADTEPSSDECDGDPRFASYDILQDYSGYAVSTSSPADNRAVLLECLQTTAVNVHNGLSRSVIVFFDSGSNFSYISMKLARELRLPCLERMFIRVNTFGTDATTAISGFATSVVLRSPKEHTVDRVITATDRIPPSSTSITPPSVTQRAPTPLQLGYNPTDPLNLWTLDDPVTGPANSAGQETEASALAPANSAGPERDDSFVDAFTYSCSLVEDNDADSFGGFALVDNAGVRTIEMIPEDKAAADMLHEAHQRHLDDHYQAVLNNAPLATELYGTTAFTTLCLGLPSKQPQDQWLRQRSSRKTRNPLDTNTEPLPPTRSTSLAVAAVSGAANSAAWSPTLPSHSTLLRKTEEEDDRTLASQKTQRRRAPALGFDMRQCYTTLGRKPGLRDSQLVTTTTLRKTQLRSPPSPADRRNLGTVESTEPLYANGRRGNAKLCPPVSLFPAREAQKAELIYQDDISTVETPSSTRAAPRADPPAGQSLQTKATEPHDEPSTRTDASTKHDDALALTVAQDALSIYDRPIFKVADEDFTEHETIKVTANSAATETPPISATIAEQKPRAQDARAATDARTPTELSATPDDATSTLTDAPAIATSAASQAVLANATDADTCIASLTADVAPTKDLLFGISTALLGPSAPTTPDANLERGD